MNPFWSGNEFGFLSWLPQQCKGYCMSGIPQPACAAAVGGWDNCFFSCACFLVWFREEWGGLCFAFEAWTMQPFSPYWSRLYPLLAVPCLVSVEINPALLHAGGKSKLHLFTSLAQENIKLNGRRLRTRGSNASLVASPSLLCILSFSRSIFGLLISLWSAVSLKSEGISSKGLLLLSKEKRTKSDNFFL